MTKQLTALQELNKIQDELHVLLRKYPNVHTFDSAWEALSKLGNASYKMKELDKLGLVLGSQVELSTEFISRLRGNGNFINNEFIIVDVSPDTVENNSLKWEVTFSQKVKDKTYGFTILDTIENIKANLQ